MLFEPQLELPVGAYPPDLWDAGQGVSLPLDHVISRDSNGKPLSHVGDFTWNLTFYDARNRTRNLVFWYWRSANRTVNDHELTDARIARMRELQYLMFLRIYRLERTQSPGTLHASLLLIRYIAAFAEDRGCSVRDVLAKSESLDDFIAQLPNSRCQELMKWIYFLDGLDPQNELGFELARPRRWSELVDRAKDYQAGWNQTAPLPTRIYLGLIGALDRELSVIEANLGKLEAVAYEAAMLYRDYKAKGWKMGASFGPDLLAKHGVTDLLQEYGCKATLMGFTALLSNIQRVAKLQVHVFSGMRNEEALYLPYHCMQFEKAGHGRKHALIAGVTTKLAGGRIRRTKWVTTEEQGFRAIRVAQAIAALIYGVLGVAVSTVRSREGDFPLFMSTGYLPWVNNQTLPLLDSYAPMQQLEIQLLPSIVKERLFSIVEAEDLEELEAIDPFRDWASETEFAVGSRWNLKSHQLRRSLALYSNASGLVKSSSLRRQLQHITSEMSYYYGRGSVFAKNFLKDDPKGYAQHIVVDWQDSEQEAQYLAFTRDVLSTVEPLFGPAGIFYDLQKKRGEVLSSKEVKAQLKSGRMAYKAHPLGGCTQVGSCDKQKGLRLTSGICVSQACKSLIGKHSQILKIIPIQRGIVARLDPESIAYAMEKEELDILEATEKEWSRAKHVSDLGGASRG